MAIVSMTMLFSLLAALAFLRRTREAMAVLLHARFVALRESHVGCAYNHWFEANDCALNFYAAVSMMVPVGVRSDDAWI